MLEHGMYTYHYLVLNSHVNICLHVETSHISMMLIIDFIAVSISWAVWGRTEKNQQPSMNNQAGVQAGKINFLTLQNLYFSPQNVLQRPLKWF